MVVDRREYYKTRRAQHKVYHFEVPDDKGCQLSPHCLDCPYTLCGLYEWNKLPPHEQAQVRSILPSAAVLRSQVSASSLPS